MSDTYRLIRYFRRELDPKDPVALEVAGVLAGDLRLLTRLQGLLEWIAGIEAEPPRAASLGGLASALRLAKPLPLSPVSLLPERGPEREKLMLDKEYKKRMLKAFASILAKRRETHALFDMFALGELAEFDEGPSPKKPLPPRLRVEPNATPEKVVAALAD